MQLKYLDLDGLTLFHGQLTEKITTQIDTEIEAAGTTLESNLQSWVNSKLGVASGIATLDVNGKLTASQLPDIQFPDYSTTYVSLTANQNVQGNKTFQGTTTLNIANFGSNLRINSTGISKLAGTVSIGSSSSPIDNIYATAFHGNLNGNATTATTATKLGGETVGNNMTPIYLNEGVPTAMPYTIQKSVPSDAIFTDTVYTLTPASDTALGGIRTNYSGTEPKRYAIKVDSNGDAYVDVAWTDTTYTLNSFGITVTAADINQLADVTDNVQVQIDNLTTQLENKLNASLKGTANGVAELDSTGKIPSSQLPSSVDEIIEVTDLSGTGESGKIYVNTTDNKTYRWSGSQFVEISSSLALGETETTAYRGDRGKTAYDHSQLTSGNPHNVTYAEVGAPSNTGTNASGTWGINITGSAESATTAETATSIGTKTVTLQGDVEGTANWDTSGNLTIDTVMAGGSLMVGSISVDKHYWHTEFTESTSSVTIENWASYKNSKPDVEVFFNGFLLFPMGSDGVGEYSLDLETGVITFPTPLGGNTTQQQIVVVIRIYNQELTPPEQTAAPTFSWDPDGGTLTINSTTENATIKYSLNDSDPVSNGTDYSGPIQIQNSPTTVYAYASCEGYLDSNVTSNECKLRVKTPSIDYTVESGTFSLSCDTAGATIKYSLNDATPSTEYEDEPVAISTSPTTVYAQATLEGYLDSVVTNEECKLKVAEPTLDYTESAGTFTLSCDTPGATIKYSLNDPDVTSNGTVYSNSPVTITTSPTTVYIQASLNGYINSDIASSQCKLKVATPQISYDMEQETFTLSCNTPGATIKYSLNDPNPSSNGTVYSNSPVRITSSPTTVYACATLNGYTDSGVANTECKLQVATPQINYTVDSGTFTISCDTPSTTIKYSLNNADPSTGTVYSNSPVRINDSPTMVYAYATRNGYVDSKVTNNECKLKVATPVISIVS